MQISLGLERLHGLGSRVCRAQGVQGPGLGVYRLTTSSHFFQRNYPCLSMDEASLSFLRKSHYFDS